MPQINFFMKSWVLFFSLFFSSVTVFSQRKVIQTASSKEVCNVTDKKIKPEINTTYYWYKSNEIHQSRGDFNGELLDGEYTKSFYTNELSEKGDFELGVKKGEWKSWHTNGKLKTVSYWQDGKLSGRFYHLDPNGKLVQQGKYSNGLKKGTWIENATDTIKYRRGKIIPKKEKKCKKEKRNKNKPSLLKRIFKKKSSKEAQTETNPEQPKRKKSEKVKVNKSSKKAEKKNKEIKTDEKQKESFLKRIFKTKKDKNDAQG